MRNFKSWALGFGLIVAGTLATWACAGWMSADPEPSQKQVAAESDRLGRRLRDLGYSILPIDRPRTGYMTVQAEVAGRRLRLILDTGCGYSGLDRDRTKDLDLRWQERPGAGAGQSHLWDWYTTCDAPEISLGASRIRPATLCRAILGQLNTMMAEQGDPPVDGLLGKDILTAVGALIDCPGGRLFVRPGPAHIRSWLDNAQVYDTRQVRVRLASDPIQAATLAKLRLWVSANRGKSWERAGEFAATTTDLRYDAPGDGEYWLALQSVGRDGQTNPPAPDQLKAQCKVRVDTAARQVSRPDLPPADLRAEAIALRAEVDQLRRRVRELEAAGRK